MKIEDQLISKLEHLSKLNLTAEERKIIQKDLQNIFEMFEKLGELDTKNVQPFIHFNKVSHLREDTVGEQVSTEEALKNIRIHENPFFKVPKVID